MLDLKTFVSAAVSGVPLLFLVFVLVEILKRLKKGDESQLVTGNGVLLGSFAIGLVVGLAYAIAQVKPPTGGDWYAIYVYWFAAAVYGLGLGGFASIFYETLKGLVTKVIEKLAAAGVIKIAPPDPIVPAGFIRALKDYEAPQPEQRPPIGLS